MSLKLNKTEKEVGQYILRLNLNSDQTKAYLEVVPKSKSSTDLEEHIFPNVFDIVSFLNEHNISYGVDDLAIEKIILNKSFQATLIATGKLPIKGKDAEIVYNYDVSNKIKLMQDDNGNIDFKNLNWFSQVKIGDVIAYKIPAKDGIDGINVNNVVIKSDKGADKNFNIGKNISISEDGLSIVSDIEGVVEMIDSKISVSPVLMISGNVDSSVGNIDFVGDVFVSGDVKAGYKIAAEGSVQINGVLEAAHIYAKKDLIVKGGIQGNEVTQIIVKGSVICKFIENANIIANSNIYADFIIHSKVKSGAKIILKGKKSILVGGEIIAKDTIEASVVGSTMGTKTFITLGKDVEIEDLLENKRKEFNNIFSSIKKLEPIIKIGKEMLKKDKMDIVRKVSFAKSLKEYNGLNEDLKNIEDEIHKLERKLQQFRFSYLYVKDKIYPGVKVTIFENSRYIRDFLDSCKIYLKGNEIAIERE